MEPISILRVALCGIGIACGAQPFGMNGPLTGLVFDEATHSLRHVVGMPGAARLGPALVEGLAWADVGPTGKIALLQSAGKEVRLYSSGAEPAESLIQGTVHRPGRSAWAPDGSAVALCSPDNQSAQWIRISPSGPLAEPPIPLPWPADDVTAMAADGQSRLLLFAVAGRGVYRISESGEPALLLALDRTGAIGLEPGGQTVWISDPAAAQLWEVSQPGASPTARVLATDPGRFTDLAAIAVSSGRNRLYLANPSARTIYILDRATAEVSGSISLSEAPSMLKRLGHPALYLLGQRSGTASALFLFDESAGPGVLFVPAPEEQ